MPKWVEWIKTRFEKRSGFVWMTMRFEWQKNIKGNFSNWNCWFDKILIFPFLNIFIKTFSIVCLLSNYQIVNKIAIDFKKCLFFGFINIQFGLCLFLQKIFSFLPHSNSHTSIVRPNVIVFFLSNFLHFIHFSILLDNFRPCCRDTQ